MPALPAALPGLLGTIPVLCMGLFAPPAPFLSGRVGARLAIGAANRAADGWARTTAFERAVAATVQPFFDKADTMVVTGGRVFEDMGPVLDSTDTAMNVIPPPGNAFIASASAVENPD